MGASDSSTPSFDALREVWLIERRALGNIVEGKNDSAGEALVSWALNTRPLDMLSVNGLSPFDKTKFIARDRLRTIDAILSIDEVALSGLEWPKLTTVQRGLVWLSENIKQRLLQFRGLETDNFPSADLGPRLRLYDRAQGVCASTLAAIDKRIRLCETAYERDKASYEGQEKTWFRAYQSEEEPVRMQLTNCDTALAANLISDTDHAARKTQLAKEAETIQIKWLCRSGWQCNRPKFSPLSNYCIVHKCRVSGCGRPVIAANGDGDYMGKIIDTLGIGNEISDRQQNLAKIFCDEHDWILIAPQNSRKFPSTGQIDMGTDTPFPKWAKYFCIALVIFVAFLIFSSK